uniref:Uncharacterized protein n=1 Tax=Panagrolaimus sp. JU765 TaxID=591449 RepID=A0AC34RGG0_9BILA
MSRMRESNFNPVPLLELGMADLLEKKSVFFMSEKYEKLSNLYVRKPLRPLDLHGKPPEKHWMGIDVILTIELAKAMPFMDKFSDKDKVMILEGIQNCR